MKRILFSLAVLFFVAPLFANTFTVSNSGTTFIPDSTTITQGDTVLFSLASPHNAQEVDSLTWANNSNTPVTGFNTPVGGGVVTGLSLGTHYYVCAPHASMGMKGKIVVRAADPSVQFVITSSTFGEGIGTFNLAVSIANANANPTSVDVNVVGGGSANSGVDYTYSPFTITFPANFTFTQNVTVNIVDDQLVEGNESFTFQLAFPTNNATIGANAQHTVTIADNDVLQISMASPSISQYENIGQVNIPVQLTKISPNATSVTVHLVPTGTTATQGNDFFFNDTTITWAANSSGIRLVPVTVVDDALVEPDETVRFQLINPTNGAVLVNDTFQLIIRNNDTVAAVPATIRFITTTDSVTEFTGVVPVIVEVNNPSSTPVSFIVARNDAASTANVVLDYTFQNAPFTNGQGVSYDTVYYHVIDDHLIEPTETAVLHLLPVSSNALIGIDSVYTLSIVDNDTLTFSFNGAGYSYVEDTGLVQIRITISSPVDTATSVSVTLATGNATNGADFTFHDTTVVFPANSIDTQSVWVRIIDDAIIESNEQINFNLVNPSNGAHLGITAYTITIIDNDTPSGIKEAGADAGMEMYPNPVSSKLFIQTETELVNVLIIDVLGNVVMQLGKLPTGKNSTDVSSLSAGMYFVSAQGTQRNCSKRFVKQN